MTTENKRMFSYIRTGFSVPSKKIVSILFDISRYGKHQCRMDFDEPLYINEAICKVEHFLSLPIDDEYYDKVKDDLFCKRSDLRNYLELRGDCLGDLKFLEEVKEIEQNVVKIVCGS
jgi:hypothetical protein